MTVGYQWYSMVFYNEITKLLSKKLFEIRRLSDLPVFNKASTAQRHTHTHTAASSGAIGWVPP